MKEDIKTIRNSKTGETTKAVIVDGKIVRNEDGSIKSPEQYFQEQEAESTSGLEAFKIGMGKRTRDLITGIEDLTGGRYYDYDDPGTAGYEALKEARPFTTGAGEAASELAQMAMPIGAAGATTKAANLFAKSPFAKATLDDIIGASLMAGLRDPGEDNTRLENAGSEALMSLAGGAVTKTLARPFTPTSTAQKMLDEGMYLTPGQATDSPGLNAIENAMEVTPGFARATKGLRGEAQKDWQQSVVNEVASQLGVTIPKDATGAAAFRLIDDAIRDGYKEAFASVTKIPDEAFDPLYKGAAKRAAALSPTHASDLRHTLKRLRIMRKQLARGRKGMVPSKVADSIDSLLRDKASQAEGPLAEMYRTMRQQFHSGLEPNVAKKLAALDSVYPQMKVLDSAVSSANLAGIRGEFMPHQLMQGSKSAAAGRTFAREESPLYDLAAAGMETVGKKAEGQPLEWFRRLAGGFPSPPGMKAVGKGLIGELEGQQLYRDLPDTIRRNLDPAKFMAAAHNEEEEEDNIVRLLRELAGY